jgi:CRP/FNR family transcriptional regulator, cyclic AMP receptor protein
MNAKPSPQELQEITFLQKLPTEYFKRIAEISQFRDFKKGEILFDEGEVADNLYLIVAGSVLLQACSKVTGCKPIMSIGAGESLGWSALTDDGRYAAKALVIDPLQVVQIDGSQLRRMCDEDSRFGYEFLRRTLSAVSKRLHVTWKQVAEVCVCDYLPVGATAEND